MVYFSYCRKLKSSRMNKSELQKHRQRLDAIVETAYDGIISVDVNKRITFINTAACKMFGYTFEQASQMSLNSLIPAKHRLYHDHYFDDFRKSQELSRGMQARASVNGVRRDMTTVPLEISSSKIILDGEMEMVAVIRDVSGRAQLMQNLREAATLDHLTGLANKRVFNEELQAQIALCNRYGHHLSLILTDLDHFKKVNDRYGHASGDEVLKQIAYVLKETVRDSDIVARWGGEEFAILVPSTDLQGVVTLAEKLREKIAECRFTFNGKAVQISASFGVVKMGSSTNDIISLFEEADKLLYQAKKAGRNCVKS